MAIKIAGSTIIDDSRNIVSAGIATATEFDISGSTNTLTAGGLAVGIATVTGLNATNLNVSGISTLGSIKVSSGIVTAVTGVVTYYGDGSQLTGVAAAGAGGASDITANLFF